AERRASEVMHAAVHALLLFIEALEQPRRPNRAPLVIPITISHHHERLVVATSDLRRERIERRSWVIPDQRRSLVAKRNLSEPGAARTVSPCSESSESDTFEQRGVIRSAIPAALVVVRRGFGEVHQAFARVVAALGPPGMARRVDVVCFRHGGIVARCNVYR